MSRFYIDKSNIIDNQIIIKGKDFNHIKNVLRMKCGDKIEICNSDKTVYYAHITKIDSDSITAITDNIGANETEPLIYLTIMQCIPKGDKLSTVIQKCVELGVSEIVPVLSVRCVSRPENKKTVRWNSISEEAAKQCKRGIIPLVTDIIEFNRAVDRMSDYDIKLICYESEHTVSLHDVDLSNIINKKIAVIIGPEGGFEYSEKEYAENKGFISVSLGKRILRTETVAPVVAGIIMYCANEI